jgi:hypothetical protein
MGLQISIGWSTINDRPWFFFINQIELINHEFFSIYIGAGKCQQEEQQCFNLENGGQAKTKSH